VGARFSQPLECTSRYVNIDDFLPRTCIDVRRARIGQQLAHMPGARAAWLDQSIKTIIKIKHEKC
jgi:hypothetical protein